VRFTNLTRANEIGANSYLVEFGDDGRVVLDTGMHPRLDGVAALPDFSQMPIDSVDAIFVTHAHQDHVGTLPVLMREQDRARVFMSEPTYFLAEPLLRNSVEIMTKQRTEKNMPEYPLFTHRELDRLTQRWQACGLNRDWSLEGYPNPKNEALTFRFYDAGHILGAVGVEFNHRGRKIFYTGDVNFSAQTLVRAAKFPEKEVDVLIIETTRGAQPRREDFTRQKELDRLAEAIERTFAQGGAVLIPVFAMGKTQEMLAALHFMQRQGQIPHSPIYIGGLGRAFTEIYDRLAARTDRAHANLRLLDDIAPQVMDGRLARQIKPRKGHIYLISSGMMTENTLSNVFAQEFLAHERHSIFFVGYCDPDSPAGRLKATPRGNKVMLHPHSGEQPVLCRVESFDMTAHAQREDILDYILRVNPRVCVLVHGEVAATQWFERELAARQPGMKVVIPAPSQKMEL
jgi:Cft2 family RNA processing exonuclease